MALTPKGFPKTLALIKSAGYKVREVDVSDYFGLHYSPESKIVKKF